MASSQLYREARKHFVQEAETRYRDSKDLEILRDFLSQNSRPEDAQDAAVSLKHKAVEKWGCKKVGDVEIPAMWIDRLMANIGNFVAVGNYAMTGAPESVGLAWFAVKLTLSAIQSNYELYTFFGSALTDISEIMIIIPHYDRLYDERTSKREWKPSPVVEKLFQSIIHAYAAVLNFSFSVRRHLGAGTLAKLRHGFKDFFGASKAKFEGKMATIASFKQKILEESQAIFQDKALHQLDALKGILGGIEGAASRIENFQSEFRKMQEEQKAQWALVLKSMEDIKATTKPKSAWDFAIQRFEKIKEVLDPLVNTSDALGEAIDGRYPGTCEWIFENTTYQQWLESNSHGLLCLNGLQDSGKSTVLATAVEHLDLKTDESSIMLYLNCASGRGASKAQTLHVNVVCNTLLYLLYKRAMQGEENVKLLEDCSKVFADPKKEAKDKSSVVKQNSKTENLPEFADAFLTIASHLGMDVVVALDEADSLSEHDQQELASKIRNILNPSDGLKRQSKSLKFLVGCRSTSRFFKQLEALDDKLHAIDVGNFNDADMKHQLVNELDKIPGLTSTERTEATDFILKQAGSRFAYIDTIAVPFMREPFQRPLSRRLESLPKGMSGVYSEAIKQMKPNYLDLLKMALTWTLLAPVPLKAHEIMDNYHGTYNGRGLEFEQAARDLEEAEFSQPAALEIEQLQDACGPFLRLETEIETGHQYVHLQDPPQVREFCIQNEATGPRSPERNDHICQRCMSSTASESVLTISPKDGHLELALACMKTMNNPVFQRRCTNYEGPPHGPPLWKAETSSVNVSQSANDAVELVTTVVDDDTITDVSDVKQDTSNVGNVEKAGSELGSELKVGLKDLTVDRATAHEAPTMKTEPLNAVTNGEVEDSDDSQDDEDRGDIDLTTPGDKSDQEAIDDSTYRYHPYEIGYWFYHIRQAESLWSEEEIFSNPLWAELFNELEYWVSKNNAWFSRWQIMYDTDLAFNKGKLKPLHLAAYLGLTSWASQLIKNGADVNEAPQDTEVSRTPLQIAGFTANNPKILQLLLENGADPNLSPDGGLYPFHRWLWNNWEPDNARLFLKHGANPSIVDPKNKFTALHSFSWAGDNLETLELILDHAVDGTKIDLNAQNVNGDTALHELMCRREVPIPILEALIKRGANVNIDNNWSARPLQMACIYGELEALKVLCQRQTVTEIDDLDDEEDTALHQAAINNFTDCVKFLLEMGANPDIQNKRGRTAIHDVAWQGSKEGVEVLLRGGAHSNIMDKHNRNPFFFACLDVSNEEKALLLLRTLLDQKIPLTEINAPTKRHRTPLREAAAHGFDQVVKELIDAARGADDLQSLAINMPDTRRGMTPLHRAAWLGKAECVGLLLNADADVSIRDADNKTPLMRTYEQWARASRMSAFEDIISLLVDKDQQAAAVDPELVAICAVNGSTRLLQQLSSIGANLNGQDRYGWTPLELAQKSQQLAASRFLKQQAAWAGMLPSSWAKEQHSGISEDGRAVKHSSGERICVSTDRPLPAGLDKFYFEVTSRPLGKESDTNTDLFPIVAVGFCTIGGPAIRFPGWPPSQAAPSAQSWGYHGDDGVLFDSSVATSGPVASELPYRVGDTIGCGVDLITQTIWYTRNGMKLESGFKNVRGRLFPLLGLNEEVELETNLVGPFLWKNDDEMDPDATESGHVQVV
ncbi:hypothetical protein ACN47E_000775 [Coniothyrium glycines]